MFRDCGIPWKISISGQIYNPQSSEHEATCYITTFDKVYVPREIRTYDLCAHCPNCAESPEPAIYTYIEFVHLAIRVTYLNSVTCVLKLYMLPRKSEQSLFCHVFNYSFYALNVRLSSAVTLEAVIIAVVNIAIDCYCHSILPLQLHVLLSFCSITHNNFDV
jgi:hypothetical protein